MKRGNYMNVFSPEGEKNFHFFVGRFNQYEHRSFIIKTSLVLKPYLGRNENDQSRFSTKQCHPDSVFTKSVLLSNICSDQLDTSARK